MTDKPRLMNCTVTLSKSTSFTTMTDDPFKEMEERLPLLRGDDVAEEIIMHAEPYVENLEQTPIEFLAQEAAEMFAEISDRLSDGSAQDALAIAAKIIARDIAGQAKAPGDLMIAVSLIQSVMGSRVEGANDHN